MTLATDHVSAIQSILEDEVNAWNTGDAEGYSRHFDTHGTFTNIRGIFAIGYDIFLERHKQILNGIFSNTTLKQEISSLRFLGEDLAIVETFIEVFGCPVGKFPGVFIDDQGVLRTRLLQVLNRNNEQWKIIAYHNVDIKEGVPL
jgi:uncharacterized protein (TIGR02246 family)